MERCTTSDGVSIAYEVTGDAGAAVPVVLVHGITDSHGDWDGVVDRLSPHHRCIALDLRGHGMSGDAEDYSSLAMTADVAAVVAATGVDRPAVVGHSLGGVVVTAYAAGAAVSAVVNVDQSLRFSDFASSLRPLEPILRGDGFHDALGMVFSSMQGTRLTPEQQHELAGHRIAARQDVVLGVWSLVFVSTDEELDGIAGQIGGTITAPYLSLHGLDPGPGYAEWLQARIPQATVEHWDDHGHYPHLVDPDRFVARLRQLLAGTAG